MTDALHEAIEDGAKALLKRALDALLYYREQTRPISQCNEVIAELRAALAAPQPSHGIVASDTFRVNMLRLAPSLSDDDITWLANIAVRSRLQPGQPRDSRVCHAPGDKCLGCDHCYGRADRCAYAPQPDQRLDDNETDPTVLWAEIHRLRFAIQGPDGYASWQDAATDERIKRVRAEKALKEVTSAQPAQPEPVAWMSWHAGLPVGVTRHEDECNRWIGEGVPVTPLYAAPPTRTAVPLTDEEIDSIWFLTQSSPPKNWRHVVVRNIERAVWEKNGIGGGE